MSESEGEHVAAGDAHAELEVRGGPFQGVASATFGFFVGFAGVVLFGPVAAEFEGAMGLSGLLLGLLVAAPQLTGSLLRIPFGAWVEKTGAKMPFLALLGLSIVGMGGLLVLLVTTAPDGLTMAHYPLVFLLGSLSGCGIATFSVGTAQTSYWYPSPKQGTVLAAFGGLGNTSPAIFTIVLPAALAAVGLTTTYAVWFCFLVVGTVIYARYAVDAPYFQFRKQGLEDREAKRRAEARGQELFPNGDALESIQEAARIPRTWSLVALFFVSFGGFLALTTWLPSYWQSYHGLESRTAGLLTALGFTLLSAAVRIGGGALSDRVGGEKTAIASFATIAVAAAILIVARDFALALAATMLLGAGMGVASAAVFQLVPKYVPDAVGGASGLVGGIGAFGGFVVPPLLGLFVDLRGVSGYAAGFVVYLVLGFVAIGLSSHLYRTQPVPRAEAGVPADD
ncbi:MFS transporter [Halopiger aswanensis]|uniref:NNP family nitrate/nitrite transporter-like MFS transporter n=1 Tax=Halopiger aswanensis TaxID=148449 RepID=A0A419WDQ1_9EURY|nr:MFS transporter [Halopiger aswanensis]RKD93595.1 NNP family nitrate/nitrite transporter-like MFS transporter [Halopiger aswanensis]